MDVLHCPVLKDRKINKSLCYGVRVIPCFQVKSVVETYLFGCNRYSLEVVRCFAYQAQLSRT